MNRNSLIKEFKRLWKGEVYTVVLRDCTIKYKIWWEEDNCATLSLLKVKFCPMERSLFTFIGKDGIEYIKDSVCSTIEDKYWNGDDIKRFNQRITDFRNKVKEYASVNEMTEDEFWESYLTPLIN